MPINDSEAYVALNLLPGMGPVRARRLVEAFGSPSQVLQTPSSRLKQVEGIGNELAETIYGWEKLADPTREKELAKQCGATILTQADEAYPESLRHIYDAPLTLYIRGSLLARDQKGVAVVGTRSPSYYGKETARKLSFQMAYAGITVVSGLARGIDSAAHEGALAAKGRTVAVLGCGIDQVYPSENKALAEKIAAAGAVVSEFPVGTKPDRQTFPIRNRTVSGLSMGVLVVEAAVNSGALITARMALDQGRHVFAVPGRIDTPDARGCHQLIKQGARLVEEVGDVLSEFEFLFPSQSTGPTEKKQAGGLEGDDLVVWDAVGTGECAIDEITRNCGLPVSKVSAILLNLEIKRRVKSLPGKYFTRVCE